MKPESTSALETVVCGGTAGLVARFFIAPLDVLKIRLQLQSTERRYRGIVHGFRTIVREEGVRGLWKGNASAELLYVTYSGVQFLAYQQCTDFLSTRRRGGGGETKRVGHAFIAGAVAGAVATTATYPFDLLRTRFAAQGSQREQRIYLGVAQALRHVVAEEGARGLYRGLGASVAQIVPYMGLLFGTYEPCRRVLEGHVFHGTLGEGWAAGAAAGFIAGTASKTGVFPLDVVRKRLQVQGPARTSKVYVLSEIPIYNSSLACAVKIWQREGIRGFYKGLLVSLLKSAPSSAITLWTFEQSAKALHGIKDAYGYAAE